MSKPKAGASLVLIVISAFFCSVAAQQNAPGDRIRVLPNEPAGRVDVSIDGKPFTAYIWPANLAKPVLYPLRTAKGTLITRGYPLEPRPGERVDHPHHVALWFNYGNVNSFDFLNNSEAIKPEHAPNMRLIRSRAAAPRRSPRWSTLASASFTSAATVNFTMPWRARPSVGALAAAVLSRCHPPVSCTIIPRTRSFPPPAPPGVTNLSPPIRSA